MVRKDDAYYFNIGGRTVYAFRDEDRMYFGMIYKGKRVMPNFAKDQLFEHNPEHYLVSVLAFLEQQHESIERG